MSKYSARYGAARYASDERHDSQVAFLQRVYLLTGDDVPSKSQIIRRAVGLLVDHVDKMVAAGRAAGLSIPKAQDVAAEHGALREFGSIATAPPPRAQVDGKGRLLTYREAVAS